MVYAIIFGGSSYEHEISIVSAIVLKEKIKEKKIFIFIDENRNFYLIDEKDMKAKYFSSKNYKNSPILHLKKGGFYQKALLKEKRVDFDVAINLVHGRDGEDGKLASLFDFFEIDYIGPRIEASVISYNKHFTKMYAEELGIKVIDYQIINKDNIVPLKFEYPVIIKPLRLGSSIGVSIVRDDDELSYALDVAFEFDDEVIVEPFIEGIKEYNLAGCKAGSFIFSIVEEPKKSEFLDFEKKYLDFSRSEKVEAAKIQDDLEKRLKEAFIKIYDPIFSGALIRCDFFVKNGDIYLNEINPIPGSLANYLFEDFNTVLNRLSSNLVKEKKIKIDYNYIHSIHGMKNK
ncbi:D-alanine--D-alanine ligase [Nitrosophilus kaiyonis]|uniref:D-alanine--D-alanine ligase n=1 Tax=Nitrosophilus kaiyonis TaxID=2930200 RepID=UPI002492BA7D|nr:D-alanine--D-alanine ligase [Nitrosophilus kaiyonis]